MAKATSRFFQTKAHKASEHYRAGVDLYLRGRHVGSIRRDKATGQFYVSVINGNDVLASGEFANFVEADQFAWINATSNAKRAA